MYHSKTHLPVKICHLFSPTGFPYTVSNTYIIVYSLIFPAKYILGLRKLHPWGLGA